MTEPDTFPVEDARKKFADILDGTQFRSTHTEITRRGKRAGYVVPPEWYDRASEALEENAALRRKVEELSAAKDARPALATSRAQVTQALPKPVPGISPKVAALPHERVQWLAEKADEQQLAWVQELRQEYPHLSERDMDYLIVDTGHRKGLKIREIDEPADRPVSEEEAAEFAARARSHASEMEAKKLDQVAESAADGCKGTAVMHAALDMGLLTHDEVYGAGPVRPDEETTP